MRLKTLVLLAIAGMCGLVAMMGVQQVLSTNASDGKSEGQKVLVATAEILPGQILDEKNVEFKVLPAEAIPEGAVTKPEQVQDRTLKVRAFAGDLITVAKLAKKGGGNAANDVPNGMRAVSIPIDPTMTGAGLIHPGDKVDVLVTYRSANSGRDQNIGKEVKTVLEHIEVFAIDGLRDTTLAPANNNSTQPKNVSLLVTSEQAKLLKLAGGVGDLHLTLRGASDEQQTDKDELFDPRQAESLAVVDHESRDEDRHPVVHTEPVSEPAKKTKKWKIEIYEGTKSRIEEVDLPEETAATPPTPTAAAQQAKQTEQAAQPWVGSIKKLFGG